MLTNNLLLPVFGALIFILFINVIRKSHFSIERSFLWVFVGGLILFITIMPKMIDEFSSWVGINYGPSVLFLCSILFLLYVIFRQEQMMTEMDEKIKLLVQSNAIMDNQVRELNDAL